MGISQIGSSTGARLVAKSGSSGVIPLPNSTGVSAATTATDFQYGAWAQLVASTSVEYLIMGVSAVANGGSPGQSGSVIVDIGMGGSGSESTLTTITIFASQAATATSSGARLGGTREFLPIRIPAGTRLAARAALSFASGATNTFAITLQVAPYANVEGN